ncbi:bifunctional oligoribonuclease/PAP phosphatase NrnA [Candidatus Peregrinibacteria bacterium]|nr:MAG: bifunctional oligoribonuclease/PAP phosphatase NrnA [Candidatus Peregrinibacteria bacterium]
MSSDALNNFAQAKTLLDQAKRVVIIAHKNPDADAVGSNLAMREALENNGKQVLSACVDPIPENCRFLHKAETFVQDFNPADFDLIITQDCGGHKVMAFHETKPELLDRSKTLLLNIDHHASNDHFGTVNVVMPEAPATCFILFLMFSTYGWTLTPTMATALLHGLYYDTGSFMHSNTNATALRIAARLQAIGADHSRSIKEQFHTHSLAQLKLWGRALERASLNSKQAVVTGLSSKDFQELGANKDDVSGLINYLNHASPAKFCVLLTEEGNGIIKGSMRTQDPDIDLSALSQLFGGGGHTKAAGFSIPGRLVEKRSWGIS